MAKRYLQGLPELRRKLERLRERTAPQVQKAMEVAADRIVERMKSLVPVDQGDLRNSIGWTWGQAPKGSVKFKTKAGPMTLTIYAGDEKAFYARWVEFGTAPHDQGGRYAGTTHPGNPAQPFFYPAYRAHKKETVAAMRKAVRAAVMEAVR
jgi:HK97 gp10 family phage protein